METPLTAPCIFCGNDRPLEADVCPSCGRGWIDSVLPSPDPDPGAAPHEAPPATEQPEAPPEPTPPVASRPTVADRSPQPSGTADVSGPPEQLGFTTEEPADEGPEQPTIESEEALPVHTDAADTGWDDAAGWDDGLMEGEPEPETAPEATPSDDVGDEWDPLVPWDAKDWGPSGEAGEGHDEEGDGEAQQGAGVTADPDPRDTGDEERPEREVDADAAAGVPVSPGVPEPPVRSELPEPTEVSERPEPPEPPEADERPGPAEADAEPGLPETPGVPGVDETPPAPSPAVVEDGFDDLIDLPEPDDSMLAPLAAAEDRVPAAAPRVAEEPPAPTLRASQVRSRRVQSLVVLAVVAAVIVGWFVILALITRGGDDGVAAPSATTTTTGDPSTTSPDDTSSPSTSAPTTTAAPTTIPQLVAEGEPLAIDDLALGGFALGPFDFGSTDALGRLVATFGQPDAVVATGEEWGTCAGDAGFVATWGPLDVIFLGTAENATLAGYRVHAGGGDHPAAGLTTLSGFTAGGTVGQLQEVYADFDVSFADVDGAQSFILSRVTDGVTLLWGPVSSSDAEGVVEGVYSPRPCDQGPAPAS